MTFPTAINAMLQAIGALLVFVTAYLALVLSAIIGLVIAELISERASPAWASVMRSGSLEGDGVSSEVQGNTRGSTGLHRLFQTQAAIHGSASYGYFHPHVKGLPDGRHIPFQSQLGQAACES